MSSRCFLFSYTHVKENTFGQGRLLVDIGQFPKESLLLEEAKKISPEGTKVVITGWTEFKSREDFLAYKGIFEYGLS